MKIGQRLILLVAVDKKKGLHTKLGKLKGGLHCGPYKLRD